MSDEYDTGEPQKVVQCSGHDGLGGCDHVTKVPESWVHFTAYCSVGCYVSDDCDTPTKCAMNEAAWSAVSP